MGGHEIIYVFEVFVPIFLLRVGGERDGGGVIDRAELAEGETADGLTPFFEERFVICKPLSHLSSTGR